MRNEPYDMHDQPYSAASVTRELWRQAGDEADAGQDSGWAVPWSDLMMVMFVLFVVLFVFATREHGLPRVFDRERENHPEAKIPTVVLDSVMRQLKVVLGERGLLGVSVRRDPGGDLCITLHGPLFFDKGQAALNQEARPVLVELARIIGPVRSRIIVSGHVDGELAELPTGAAWEISLLRAARLTVYLTEELGLDPERFVIQGLAATAPLVPETTPQGKDLNRRVEIRLTAQPL